MLRRSLTSFVDLSRDLRPAGERPTSALPPRAGAPAPSPPPPPAEASLSVIDDEDAAAAGNRIKFNAWMDALSGRGGAGAQAGSGRARPLTAPANGRHRPVSARPGAGVYTVYAPGAGGGAVAQPARAGRPLSAQPAYARPVSAGRGGYDGAREGEAPRAGSPPPGGAGTNAMGSTAEVAVGGVAVSWAPAIVAADLLHAAAHPAVLRRAAPVALTVRVAR